MSSSQCTSCGLIHQPGRCQRQTSTTDSDDWVITPGCCCTYYFSIIAFFSLTCLFSVGIVKLNGRRDCFVELFANSISVSNANVSSAADWRVGFVARSSVTGCKVSIHALNSRLIRGVQVISNSSNPSSDYFVKGDKTAVVFEKVVVPGVTGDVIWNIQVDEIMIAINIKRQGLSGLLMAACPAIPVKFTTDPAGKVIGSLLGNVRRCNFKYQHNLA